MLSTLKYFKVTNRIHNDFSFLLSAMLSIVARSEWGARDAKLVETFSGVIPYVIIHHSYIPSACFTQESCEAAMRKMQDMHQLQNSWNDIGYSFAIGGDGRIYHGRGYNVIGAHAPRYNNKSIGICLIGDWTSNCSCYFPALFEFSLKKTLPTFRLTMDF